MLSKDMFMLSQGSRYTTAKMCLCLCLCSSTSSRRSSHPSMSRLNVSFSENFRLFKTYAPTPPAFVGVGL